MDPRLIMRMSVLKFDPGKIVIAVTTCPWTGELHTRPKDHY
ncbi:hypothetical protein VN97_g11853, partial [Penicillium thymicola]